jgi:hypothetical protein
VPAALRGESSSANTIALYKLPNSPTGMKQLLCAHCVL